MKQTSEMRRTGFPRKVFGAEPKQRTRKCALKTCRQPFQPRNMTHKVFSPECGLELARIERERADKANTRERLAKLKTRTEYANDTQKAVNLYVKWRDWGKPCVSCGRPHNPEVARDASHLKSRGANSALRFHLWNLNMACVQCNMSNSGTIAEYYPRLIERIGQEKVDYLHYAKRERKYEKEYLIRMKKIFNKKAKRMEKRKLSEVK